MLRSPAPSVPDTVTAEWSRLSAELAGCCAVDLPASLNEALGRIVAFAGATRASLQSLHPRTGRLRIAAVHGFPPELLGNDVSTARSISEWVLSHRRGIVLVGKVRDPRFEGRTDASVGSSICLPLLDGEEGTGVLSLARADSEPHFTDADLAAILPALDPLTGLLRRVREAEARRATDESRATAPGDPLGAHAVFESRRYEFARSHRASWVESGDRCGLLAHPDGTFTLYLVDVPADGARAANLAGWIEGVLAAVAVPQRSPAGIVSQVETHLVARFGAGVTAALWVAQLGRGGEVTSCAAGLPAPLWIPSDGGAVLRHSKCGALLGLPQRGMYFEEEIRLLPGDTLVSFTDGVVFERNPAGEPFGEQRAAEALDEARARPLDGIASGLTDGVAAFSGRSRPLDDLLVLAIRYRPEN